MNERELKPLPPDIDALLAADRALPAPRPGAQDRVALKLDATLGLLGVAAAAGATGSAAATGAAHALTGGKLLSLAAWKIAVVAVGATAAVSGGAYFVQRGLASAAVSRSPVRVSVSPRAPARRAGSVPAPAVAPPPVAGAALTAAQTATARPIVSATGPSPPMPPSRGEPRAQRSIARAAEDGPHAPPTGAAAAEPVDDLAAEEALLAGARRAHARGDEAQALRDVAEHALRFPSGQLAEERESLWIQSLAAAGDADAARARATDFRRRFARSIFLPGIDAAIGALP